MPENAGDAHNVDIVFMVETLIKRTESLFIEELDLRVGEHKYYIDDVQKLELKHLTSLMSIEGNIRMYLAFTFSEPLIRHIFEIYCADIEVEEDERRMYVEETASDVINLIVGNALADINASGPSIKLSPPIIINEAKSVFRQRDARFYTADLSAEHGDMSIHCIGPKDYFDQKLNYIKATS